MRLSRRGLLALMASAALPAALAPAALAQASARTRIRGDVVAASTSQLTVRTRGGDRVTIGLPHGVPIAQISAVAVSAIKPGSFIGTAAVPQSDGTLKALEVQVFPESMRGVGEGRRPWDLTPTSTMTNGTVGDLKVADGRYLTLTYKGGEQKLFVPPGTPVITYLPGSLALLQQGAHVIAFVSHKPGANLVATRVGVGKDGLVPPM